MSQLSLAAWGSIIGITTGFIIVSLVALVAYLIKKRRLTITTVAGLITLAVLPGTVTGGVLGKEVTQYTEILNYLDKADADYNAGRYELAIADYSEALQRNPQIVRAYWGRGMARIPHTGYRGDTDGGISDFTAVLTANPQNSTAYEKRGRLLFFKG